MSDLGEMIARDLVKKMFRAALFMLFVGLSCGAIIAYSLMMIFGGTS